MAITQIQIEKATAMWQLIEPWNLPFGDIQGIWDFMMSWDNEVFKERMTAYVILQIELQTDILDNSDFALQNPAFTLIKFIDAATYTVDPDNREQLKELVDVTIFGNQMYPPE